MENADRPINPAISEKINDTEFFEYNLPHGQRQHSGLTKREYFAGLFIQGILAAQTEMRANGTQNDYFGGQVENIVSEALTITDELLKALEK